MTPFQQFCQSAITHLLSFAENLSELRYVSPIENIVEYLSANLDFFFRQHRDDAVMAMDLALQLMLIPDINPSISNLLHVVSLDWSSTKIPTSFRFALPAMDICRVFVKIWNADIESRYNYGRPKFAMNYIWE